jgi:hypothetical protein
MKNILKIKLHYLFVFVVFLVSGCGHVSTGTWNQPIPTGDILFQVVRPDVYEFDLIQADGTNHQSVNLPHDFVVPVWSANGEILYGLSNPRGMIPYGDAGYPAYWNIKSGKFKNCAGNTPIYFQIEPIPTLESPHAVLLHNAREIILFDIDSCKQIKTILDFSDQEVTTEIHGISYNGENQEVVFGEIVDPYGSPSDHINVIKLNTGEYSELTKGFFPMWSPDGTQVAFFGMDGLYVIKVDENKPRKLKDIRFYDKKIHFIPKILSLHHAGRRMESGWFTIYVLLRLAGWTRYPFIKFVCPMVSKFNCIPEVNTLPGGHEKMNNGDLTVKDAPRTNHRDLRFAPTRGGVPLRCASGCYANTSANRGTQLAKE